MKTNGVSGSTVVCFKYNNGIVMASDTGANYGSLCMQNFKKIYKVTDNCITGFSGSISDHQYLHQLILQEINRDPRKLGPQGIHKLVQRIIYNKRSELKPLNISIIIAGINKSKNEHFENATDDQGRFIGVINSKGNFWFDSYAATGIASHLILPILRDEKPEDLTKDQAAILVKRVMKILCYKDCNASNKIQIVWCEHNNILFENNVSLDANLELAINPDETVLQTSY